MNNGKENKVSEQFKIISMCPECGHDDIVYPPGMERGHPGFMHGTTMMRYSHNCANCDVYLITHVDVLVQSVQSVKHD